MNITIEVRHQAAKQVALLRVAAPAMILGAVCILLGMVSVSVRALNEFAPLLVSAGICSVLFAVLGSGIAYFLVQKFPKVLRKQLEISKLRTEDEIRGFERVLERCRAMIAEQELETAQRVKDGFNAIFEEQKAVSLKPHRDRLAELQQRDQRATPLERVRNQKFFADLPRIVSEAEAKLVELEALPMSSESQELLDKSTRDAVQGVRAEGQKQIDCLETRISDERRVLDEIERLLQSN